MAFGLGLYVSVLNDPEPDRYQSYGNAREDKGGALSPIKGAGAVQKYTPCENPESRDESDLCAQWRAAKAAEESALWARVGFFAGLLGLIGLYWQVVLTRKAVEDTGDATIAMSKANEIAERGQRPWLDIRVAMDPKQPVQFVNSTCIFPVALTALHFGEMPATNVEIIGSICSDKEGVDEMMLSAQRRALKAGRRFFPRSIFPNQENHSFTIGVNFIPEITDGFSLQPYLVASVSYDYPGAAHPHVSARVFRIVATYPLEEGRCPMPPDNFKLVESHWHAAFFS